MSNDSAQMARIRAGMAEAKSAIDALAELTNRLGAELDAAKAASERAGGNPFELSPEALALAAAMDGCQRELQRQYDILSALESAENAENV